MKKFRALLLGLTLLSFAPLSAFDQCAVVTRCGDGCVVWSEWGVACALEFNGRLGICVSYNEDGSIYRRFEVFCP